MSEPVLIIELTDSGRCWRQIHPVHVTDEFCVLEAFIPTTKDNRQLSVGHSSKTEASDCFEAYSGLGLASAGVAQMLVAAIADAAASEDVVTCLVDDSALADRPDWHCYIDFSLIGERAKRKAFAQQLWHAARREGWAFRPPTEIDAAA